MSKYLTNEKRYQKQFSQRLILRRFTKSILFKKITDLIKGKVFAK